MRHTKTITIEEEGRDKGKTFILTEMPATLGEKWAMQLMHLITHNAEAVAVNPQALNGGGGMGALAVMLAEAQGVGNSNDAMTPEQVALGLAMARALTDPSLDAWWDCVRYQHAPNHPPQPINQGAACQIEEIKTIAFLRFEVLNLHTDFFSREKASTMASPSPGTPTGSTPTRMSRPRSGQ